MKSIKDFNDYQIENLIEEVLEFARLSNAYFDYEINERVVDDAASKIAHSLLFYLGAVLSERPSKGNKRESYPYYIIDGEEVKQ